MTEINVKKVAHLARLHLTDAEIELLEPQVKAILGFVEQLKSPELDQAVEKIEPTSHPLALSNVFRADEVGNSLDIEAFLKHSPGAHRRFFEVPKIIEDNS